MTQRRHLLKDAESRLKNSLRKSWRYLEVYERRTIDASSRKLQNRRRISGGTL